MQLKRAGRARGERGVTLVVVALSLVGLCAVGGLAIDGGAAFANRRQSQNAADAAALAGTIVLDDIRLGDQTDESQVLAAVVEKLTENDADTTSFTCQILPYNSSGTGYGTPYPCPDVDLADGVFDIDDAAGVRVNSSKLHETALMRLVGHDTIRSNGTATATIQSAKGLERRAAPFMICGDSNVAPSDGFDIPLLTAIGGSFAINPDAVYDPLYLPTAPQSGTQVGHPVNLPGGPWYLIHDDSGGGADNGSGTGVPACGAGSAGFKGLVNTDRNFSIPGWWDSDTGLRDGPTEEVIRGPDGCLGDAGDIEDCYMIVPIGSEGRGTGTSTELFNVRFAMFFLRVVGSGNGSRYVALMQPGSINPITGSEVPDFALAGGIGGGRVVDDLTPYIIKLSE